MLAVGVTCLLLGAFVSLAPIFPVPSGAKMVNGSTVAYFQVHSLVLPQYLQVPWTSSQGTHITAIDCGGNEPSGSAAAICPSNRTVASGTGTSGTLSFSAQNGDWIAIGTNGPDANISLRTTNGQVGFVVLVLGVLFTLGGLFLGTAETPPRRSSRPKSSTTSAKRSSKGSEEVAAEEPSAPESEEEKAPVKDPEPEEGATAAPDQAEVLSEGNEEGTS